MGAVDNFFYRHIAGINFDESNPGFQSIILKPNFIDSMDSAKATYNSIHGNIEVYWKKIATDSYEYLGKIPANCTAKVILPTGIVMIKSGIFKFKIGK